MTRPPRAAAEGRGSRIQTLPPRRCLPLQRGFQPASRRLFETTLTELNAMAALAIMGLRSPAAAIGIAAPQIGAAMLAPDRAAEA